MGLVVDIWWLIFLVWRKGVFAGGFQEKRCVERGFSMVKVWWRRGESWCLKLRIFGREKYAIF
jgi:hypothetical protein